MHLYAFFDLGEKAKQLYNKSEDRQSCMFLIPLSYISLKNGNTEEAHEYFDLLKKHNNGTVRYLRALKKDRAYEFEFPDEDSYEPFTWEELYYTFEAKPEFMKWVYQQVRLVKNS